MAVAAEQSTSEFQDFMERFSKNYDSPEELEKRENIFLKNLEDLKLHNLRFTKGEVTWFKSINKYMDFTLEEFTKERTRKRKQKSEWHNARLKNVNTSQEKTDLPSYYSWVDLGGVTSVKDQGMCGSCASFGTMGAIETCFWRGTGNLVSLSEQFIIDCAYGHTYEDPDPEGNPPD